MKALRTILIDDEPRGLSSLEKLLQFTCPDVEVVASCTDADSAHEKIRLLAPELVFLDISMPGKSGFELLRELNEIKFEIIFVTAHNEFMIEAFHFSAIDYLMKPVDEDLLIQAVNRSRKRLESKFVNYPLETLKQNTSRSPSEQMKLCVPSLKGFLVVELKEIIYAEASGNYTHLHLTNTQVICTSKPIHEYEQLLDDSGFARIHKSYLINVHHIKEYLRGEGGSVKLSNGSELEVARRKKESFLNKMKTVYKY